MPQRQYAGIAQHLRGKCALLSTWRRADSMTLSRGKARSAHGELDDRSGVYPKLRSIGTI